MYFEVDGQMFFLNPSRPEMTWDDLYKVVEEAQNEFGQTPEAG